MAQDYEVIEELGKAKYGSVSLVNHKQYGPSVIKKSNSYNDVDYEINLNEVSVLEYLTQYAEVLSVEYRDFWS